MNIKKIKYIVCRWIDLINILLFQYAIFFSESFNRHLEEEDIEDAALQAVGK